MKKNHVNGVLKLSLMGVLVFANISWKNASTNGKNPTLTINSFTFEDMNRNGKLDKYEDYRLPISERIDDLISKMTDEEKASMLMGTGMPGFDGLTPVVGAIEGRVPGAAGGTYKIKRLGIPEIIVADGPAGLRIKPIRDNDKNTYYCTAFPVGTALASTWNPELIQRVGKAMGNEVKEYGVDVLLAPALNIHRNPLNGRNFEYYSEDPLIAGKIAAAMVNGIQSNGVGTSIKHFAANNQETNRLSINEHITERTMRELYLKGFEITVKESNPWTVMSSYNLINGTYTSARKDLLTDILRDEWGFKGIVMTDWFGGYAGFNALKAGTSNVVAQLEAGNDLLMPGLPAQKAAILENMKNGKLSKSVVDTNLRRILELVFKSPTIAKYKYSNKPNLKANAEVTRNAAAEGMILLKNNNNLLPYTAKAKAISAFGVTSYDFIAGGTGSGDVNEAYTVSLIEGLEKGGYQLDAELKTLYTPFVAKEKAAELESRKERGILALPQRLPELELNKELIAKKAETTELAIITIGRNSGEGGDRKVDNDFNLAADEVTLINNVTEAFHAKGKKVVVILNIGGVIETASWKDKVDAILLSWQPGQEGGNSVADIISGKVNPSGKLTMTFPIKYEDTPSAKNWPGTPIANPENVTYEEGIYVGYRYFNTFKVKPSFEFGYGLSYTNFEYTDLKLSSKTFNGKLTAFITVKNTGKVAGKEIVQLYLSAPHQNIDKPVEELKAFAKTKLLKPGQSETLQLTLSPKDLASFMESKSAWIAETGTYKVAIGSSSLNIKQTAEFSLPKELEVEKVHKAFALIAPISELKSK
ncbi:glycoside hydrolase family 3 C-terminal domain-containing protein [Pedobacter sp. MR2016-19]|uniref:glycoside hydrolase family 3 N-terminal domain-containing protein n=1 Tax=Pedobacter sp. MR2016-19 TaxID=2780089 RepID=UPI0018745835|nr:glycoside hydrolase family 3 N-terminal domain-containing protein [Pedobacter sp. MR2016-19]MBE5319811.1 glycoside hydrolase family 3 C-terminal domain-containing protein [Pedobacter sp. MR2016-19]